MSDQQGSLRFEPHAQQSPHTQQSPHAQQVPHAQSPHAQQVQQPAQPQPAPATAYGDAQGAAYGGPPSAHGQQAWHQHGVPNHGAGYASPAQFPGGPAAPAGYPTARPGLLDTTFAGSTTAETAKPAYVAIMVLSAVLAVVGVFSAIADFAAIEFSGISAVLGGLSTLLLYGALAFVVLTLGRLTVDFFVQQDRARR